MVAEQNMVQQAIMLLLAQGGFPCTSVDWNEMFSDN